MKSWNLTWVFTLAACSVVFASGCATVRAKSTAPQEVRFDPLVITGDLELEKLNAEELFAGGESAFAANEFQRAARYFGRLADFFPQSTHHRDAQFNAGLALEKIPKWEDAAARFADLADPAKGTGIALDASFRLAETLYHVQHHADAAKILAILAARTDLGMNKRLEAQVQQGICELEAEHPDEAETILRKALSTYNDLKEKDEVDDYFPAQAQFFLGEIYRLHYESVQLDADRGVDQLAKDLEYKAELLLSAQGHYLRSIRMGNGYWATAAGTQIGELYENLYEHMVNTRAPRELNSEEADIYRQELRKKIRVLITKAINIYERTLETAERIGSSNAFVDKTRENLKRMKDLLVADAERDETENRVAPPTRPAAPVPSTSRPAPRPAGEPRI